ncbi:3'(2'),5'-bisphosphate nucleotidase CysQ [Poseidonocella sedimentorum]|uniref:Myo-inositol-1(Or 4)-monophosphatase n=1 Tax=Poseidonocella sedimentorum TaxID=871652 RepID=A0A1I6EFI3_9RHOB|nr:3'(2'),5'-bisphosphate nucleotidase CysQ [Poseidonocella sedimentorum]SFR16526.1 myo-inositol-1(or 4)-monophosphatase [Poseidonocella sedimentorum]
MTDLELLTRAAEAAGEIARGYFGGRYDVVEKAGGAGPVSAADLAVNAALQEILRDARPDYGWLSEESEDDPERLTRTRCFIVDPIDGTRSFIANKKTWGHALAVVEDGRVTDAVAYFPIREELFAATRGAGATLNGAPIAVSAATEPDGATILAAKPNLLPEHWTGPVPAFDMTLRPSLAYRLCAVAQGRFDASFTFRPTWEWDVAAGALIVEEAGGAASDRAGRALVFNRPSPLLDGLVVAPRLLHSRLHDRLAYSAGP